MSESIKVDIEKGLAEKFRKKAMGLYGYRKGAIKKTIRMLIKKFVIMGEVNWKSLRGVIKSELSSVELQHKAWVKAD